MRLAIIYATTQGQTRKIARFCLDQLFAQGHSVELVEVGDAGGLDLRRLDGAILGASVHAQGFQPAFNSWVAGHHATLNTIPTLFLPVSLSAAGRDEDDWAGLNRIVDALVSETGWKPGAVHHVAGAFRFSEYNLLTSWAMLWIARQKHQQIDRHEDREYTDWEDLASFLTGWTTGRKAA
jgi:menaquinone-dependent protoporphyrinogen oxidase